MELPGKHKYVKPITSRAEAAAVWETQAFPEPLPWAQGPHRLGGGTRSTRRGNGFTVTEWEGEGARISAKRRREDKCWSRSFGSGQFLLSESENFSLISQEMKRWWSVLRKELIVYFKTLHSFFRFLWYYGLNSGLYACLASAVPLEPGPSPFYFIFQIDSQASYLGWPQTKILLPKPST
jgi:hypothetical protein